MFNPDLWAKALCNRDKNWEILKYEILNKYRKNDILKIGDFVFGLLIFQKRYINKPKVVIMFESLEFEFNYFLNKNNINSIKIFNENNTYKNRNLLSKELFFF